MEVIYIKIEKKEKELLKVQAKKKGLTLTSYCRMILLAELNYK